MVDYSVELLPFLYTLQYPVRCWFDWRYLILVINEIYTVVGPAAGMFHFDTVST